MEEDSKIESKKLCGVCHKRYRKINLLCRQCKIKDYQTTIIELEAHIARFPEDCNNMPSGIDY